MPPPRTDVSAAPLVFGDALLALTDRLNATASYPEAAALLEQILEPTGGLVARLGDFFEAVGEKAKEAEEHEGFDLSYDFEDAAAEVRNVGVILQTATAQMRQLTAAAPPPRSARQSVTTPGLPAPAPPATQPSRTR
ncbi:hypothetical protein [Streptomyces sp. NPDC059928]|uniref:hypothetical protein n=1 Tax=unclassified Streptomyces TaxID=2593676 RepID=UPI00364DFD19